MNGQQMPYRPVSPQTIANYILVGIVAVFLISLASTSYYTVDTDEKGVVLFMGKFSRITEPGLRFKWPFGIETVQKVKVTTIFKEEFGFRTKKPGVVSQYATQSFYDESLMLCGDLSVAEVEWIVQYRVDRPEYYLFNLSDPQKVIRDVSEAAMRNIIGDSSVDEVLTERRQEINAQVQEQMQQVLDSYKSGIRVETVRLQDVNPPEKVRYAFNEVNAAQQDKEKMINQAVKEYNQVIPKLKGQAQQMLKQAQAYSIERVNTAAGDADRFTQIWNEYKNSKDVTRRRMYLEAMNKTLPGIQHKYILDTEVKGLLPLMNVGEVNNAK